MYEWKKENKRSETQWQNYINTENLRKQARKKARKKKPKNLATSAEIVFDFKANIKKWTNLTFNHTNCNNTVGIYFHFGITHKNAY